MKFLRFLVIFISISALNSLLANDKLDLEEFISSEDIVKNLEKYTKKMPKKMGYKGSKIWKVLIDYTAKNEHPELFGSLISVRHINPRNRTEYRNDIYTLLKKNPDFFVKSFDKYYDNKKICLVWFFDKSRYNLANLDFSSFKDRRFRKIQSNKSPSDKDKKTCQKIRNRKTALNSRGQ